MHETAQPTRIEVIARGVMFHEEHVLLCQNRKHGYYYLPGGHVEPGETAATALVREMHEEAAVDVDAGRVMRVEEHIFMQGGKARHEVNVYMVMNTAKDPRAIRSVEADIAFAWVALREIEWADIRPAHARGVISDAASSTVLAWRSVTAR